MGFEEKARKVAQAIVDEDSGSYAVAVRDADMDSMPRGELLRFRELVHALVETIEPANNVEALTHNQAG